jgi:hypothetical protein
MRTCKKIAVEMRAIIFEEAVICIDMQDIFHLQGFNVFGRVTQISIHGHNSLTKKLYEAVGFAPNSENLFSSTIFRTTFPRVRKASFYICHDPSFGISNEAIVNIVRAAAWVPEINVAKVHLTNPGGTETSTFTKSAAAAQCYGAPVL